MTSGKERLFEIVSVLRKYDLMKHATPLNLRLAIQELGPTFIKLGQILASRDDVLPKEYCAELSHLRNQVTPMPFSLVTEILDKEYDFKTKDIFKSIEEEPIGSASIAQVHKAVLKDGTIVVIKVQRQDIYERMYVDVVLIKKIISFFHIQQIFNSVFDFCDVVDEMFETAKEEMNFLVEASHTEEFRKNNEGTVYILSPKVYTDITTSHVLVMEYMDGIKINDFATLKKYGYDRNEIGEKLAANYIKQAIDDGYFHADPHPENLKIKDGKIVYLDFGMMGRLSKRDRELLSRCILDITKGDILDVERVLLTLGKAQSLTDHMMLRNDIKMVLDKNITQNISDIDIKDFTNDMLSMLSRNNITLPKDITMLLRGIIVMEGVLKEVSPDINLIQILKTHVKPHDLFTEENIKKYATDSLKNCSNLVYLPDEMLSFLKGVNSGDLRFNIELNDSKHQIRNIEQLVHLIMITILDVAYIIGTSLIIVQNGDKPLPFIFYIYLVFGAICTIWLFYRLFVSKFKNRKR